MCSNPWARQAANRDSLNEFEFDIDVVECVGARFSLIACQRALELLLFFEMFIIVDFMQNPLLHLLRMFEFRIRIPGRPLEVHGKGRTRIHDHVVKNEICVQASKYVHNGSQQITQTFKCTLSKF